MEQLADFYSECLGSPVDKAKSDKPKVVASKRRLTNEEGYGVTFPFWMLYSKNRYIMSVRPDLLDLVSILIQSEFDARALFSEDGGIVVESWCRSVLPKHDAKKIRRVHSQEHYINKENFRPFELSECRKLTFDDYDFIEEMNKESDFGCSDDCIADGTAFGVFTDNKLVARSTTISTPVTTAKYNLVWIGVETLAEYRRRGYAKAVVSRTTEALLSRELTPVYNHAVWNIASRNTAKSLGYQLYGETLRWQY